MSREYKIDIAFVILNYNLYDDVLNCIDSIQNNLDTKSFKVIVVDNASPNGVGKRLFEHYEDSPETEVILCNENHGFARGNNLGIERALAYDPKFIACINNDILLEQKDFFKVLDMKYEETGAALIGPEIRKPSGKLQSFNKHLAPIEKYKKHYLAICDDSDLTTVQLIKRRITGTKLYKLLRHRDDAPKAENTSAASKQQTAPLQERDVVLHGCCLIFSPAFFEAGLKGFNPKTFLYHEEQLLYIAVMEKKAGTLYTPDLKIIHIGNVSTNNVNNNDDEKKKEFRRKNEAASLKIMIEEMEKIR
jgi:GT2 family glycosyltransferase